VVVVGAVVVVEEVLELELLLVVVAVVAAGSWHSRAASNATVDAPCSRLRVSVGLTAGGRSITELLNVVIAFAAAAH
jgi:hypothetical protein